MHKIIRSFTLLVLLIISWQYVSGSDTAFVMKWEGRNVLTYVFDGSSKDFNTNEILRDLAEDAVKSIRSVRLDIGFNLEVVLVKSSSGCRLKPKMKHCSVGGDYHYRGFDLSDLLCPDRADIRIIYYGKGDSTGYREQEASHCLLSRSDSTAEKYPVSFFDSLNDSIYISTVFLYYDEDALDRFRERINIIQDYYASSAILDSLLSLAYSMDLKMEELLPAYFIYLEEINKAVEIIGRKDLPGSLPLTIYDPKEFRRKYVELFKLSKSLTMTFEEVLDSAVVIRSATSADSAVSLFLAGIMRWINWTLLVNDRNGNVYHEYLDNYYSMHGFSDDIPVLKKLLVKINPGESADSLLAHVFHKLYLAYGAVSDSLTKESRYAEATEMLDHARKFSSVDPYPETESFDQKAKVRAVTGIFNAYLGVARNSIRYRKFEMAENYMAKAVAYRKANPMVPVSDTLYRLVFLELVGEQLAECDSLAGAKRFLESMDCLRYVSATHDSASVAAIIPDMKAREEKIYGGFVGEMLTWAEKMNKSGDPDSALVLYDLAIVYSGRMNDKTAMKSRLDSLAPEFEKIRYGNLTWTSAYHFHRKRYEEAYDDLEKAQMLETMYGLERDPAIDTLRSVVYPKYLEKLLTIGNRKIWMNQFSEASDFADSISRLQDSMGQKSDTGLSSSIARYRSLIRDRICMNARESIEIYQIRAQYSIDRKNFIRAEMLLDSAIYISGKNPECRIPETAVRDTLSKYQDPTEFQKMLAAAEREIPQNDYPDAIRKYREAEAFYKNRSVSRFAMECEPVFDFVREKSRLHLTRTAVELFIEDKEYRKALDFLKLYRLQDGKEKDVREIQRSLGKALAVSDFTISQGKDPAGFLAGYAGEDPWMAAFTRAYLYQWNVMKNKAGNSTAAGE